MEKPVILNPGFVTNGYDRSFDRDNLIVKSSTSDMPYEVIHLKEGEVLFKEAQNPRGLYYVQSGCVKVFVNRSQARGRTTSQEYVTKLVSAGEFFDYRTLVKGESSKSSATAVMPSTIWLYSKEIVQVALSHASPLVKQLLNQAVADIETFETNSQFHYLASVQERIAYQLCLLAEKFGVATPRGLSINLKLTRNELAQLASTINESLSRHLTEFKNEGLLDLNGKEIIIKDKKALRAKSGNFSDSLS